VTNKSLGCSLSPKTYFYNDRSHLKSRVLTSCLQVTSRYFFQAFYLSQQLIFSTKVYFLAWIFIMTIVYMYTVCNFLICTHV